MTTPCFPPDKELRRELAAGSQPAPLHHAPKYFVRAGTAESLGQGQKPSDLSSSFWRGEIREGFAEMVLKQCSVVCVF